MISKTEKELAMCPSFVLKQFSKIEYLIFFSCFSIILNYIYLSLADNMGFLIGQLKLILGSFHFTEI